MYIKPVDFNDSKAPVEFVDSLRRTGFAVVKNHSISSYLMTNTVDEWKEFFNSPSKFDYLSKLPSIAGYFPFKSENAKGYAKKDLKEFFHYYPSHGLPQHMSKNTQELFLAMEKMACRLLAWIEESLPCEIRASLSMPLPKMVERSVESLIRIIHYPPLNGEEDIGAIRAQAHEDINMITLLPAASAPGLQVRDLSGTWHSIHSDPGEIVINTGDSLQELTKHYLISTPHRVINPDDEGRAFSRYSMPFFLHAHPHVRLSEKHTQESYLKERLNEIWFSMPRVDYVERTPVLTGHMGNTYNL